MKSRWGNGHADTLRLYSEGLARFPLVLVFCLAGCSARESGGTTVSKSAQTTAPPAKVADSWIDRRPPPAGQRRVTTPAGGRPLATRR